MQTLTLNKAVLIASAVKYLKSMNQSDATARLERDGIPHDTAKSIVSEAIVIVNRREG